MENEVKEQKIRTKRELVHDLLSSVHPEKDFSEEETLFGQIYDDYDEYAKMLTAAEAAEAADDGAEATETAKPEQAEAESNDAGSDETAQAESNEAPKQPEAAPKAENAEIPPADDGIPCLQGANNVISRKRARSIFDIAAGA